MTLTPFSEFHEAATCFAAATLNALSELTSRRNESCTVAASVTIVSVTAVSVEPEPSVESVESPESVFSLSKSNNFPVRNRRISPVFRRAHGQKIHLVIGIACPAARIIDKVAVLVVVAVLLGRVRRSVRIIIGIVRRIRISVRRIGIAAVAACRSRTLLCRLAQQLCPQSSNPPTGCTTRRCPPAAD